jgi:hypothetical protein
MVKAVKGYMTEDGRFFDSPQEAEMNEAEELLRKQLELQGINDVEDHISLIKVNADRVQRYVTSILGIPINGKDSENFRLEGAEEGQATEHTTPREAPRAAQTIATKTSTVKNELPLGTPLSRSGKLTKHRSNRATPNIKTNL